MQRMTVKDAERALERLTHAINRANPALNPPAHIAQNYMDVGGYFVEHGYMQGYVVAKYIKQTYRNHEGVETESHGETYPFGNTCHTARELCDMIQFAVSVLYVIKE